MSKIKDTLETRQVRDTYQEHWCHQSYHSDCSECFKENRLLKAKKAVVASNYPEGISRFNPPWND